MEKQRIISIHDGISGNPEYRMLRPVNLNFIDGEQIAIIGDNAAGKTRLVESITGAHPFRGNAIDFDFSPSNRKLVCENLKYITFKDSYGDADGNYYLQKRWNQQDIDEETPTVREVLEEIANREAPDPKLWNSLSAIFHLEGLLDRYTISLSSGELRKFQLAKALMAHPRVLIMDNPFIGLDADTRTDLSELLAKLSENMRLMMILVLSRVDEIPSFITHVVPVRGLDIQEKKSVTEYLTDASDTPSEISAKRLSMIAAIPQKELSATPFYPVGERPEIVRCDGVSIKYGQRTILRNLTLRIREGERWAIVGKNGAGKSTLLSLICADNPQSYACPISLFGHKRGSGESIWDIKKHIGYVSPEMHRAYQKNISSLEIVASGLHDTVGLFIHPSEEDLRLSNLWMDIFGISHLADRPYLKISSGEQRLCLLARAFVKDPELLILDEPFHGLDSKQKFLAGQIIEAFLQRPHKTLLMVSHYESEFPGCIDHKLELIRQR